MARAIPLRPGEQAARECPNCLDSSMTVVVWTQHGHGDHMAQLFCHSCNYRWHEINGVIDETPQPFAS